MPGQTRSSMLKDLSVTLGVQRGLLLMRQKEQRMGNGLQRHRLDFTSHLTEHTSSALLPLTKTCSL